MHSRKTTSRTRHHRAGARALALSHLAARPQPPPLTQTITPPHHPNPHTHAQDGKERKLSKVQAAKKLRSGSKSA